MPCWDSKLFGNTFNQLQFYNAIGRGSPVQQQPYHFNIVLRGSKYEWCGLIGTDWTVGARTRGKEMLSNLVHASWCGVSERIRLVVFAHFGIRVRSGGQENTYYVGMIVPDGLIESGAAPVGFAQIGVNARRQYVSNLLRVTRSSCLT